MKYNIFLEKNLISVKYIMINFKYHEKKKTK